MSKETKSRTILRRDRLREIRNLWRSDDELRIASKLEDTAPALFDGLDADSYTLDPQGAGVWQANVNYKIRNQSSESFDTTGGTVHVTQSFGTNRFGTLAPDFQGAIGVSDDRVECIMPQRGDPLSISARDWTDMQRVVDKFRNGGVSFQPDALQSTYRSPAIVKVLNETGGALSQCAIVGLGQPVILQTDNELEGLDYRYGGLPWRSLRR